jgi:hypothetical protein
MHDAAEADFSRVTPRGDPQSGHAARPRRDRVRLERRSSATDGTRVRESTDRRSPQRAASDAADAWETDAPRVLPQARRLRDVSAARRPRLDTSARTSVRKFRSIHGHARAATPRSSHRRRSTYPAPRTAPPWASGWRPPTLSAAALARMCRPDDARHLASHRLPVSRSSAIKARDPSGSCAACRERASKPTGRISDGRGVRRRSTLRLSPR